MPITNLRKRIHRIQKLLGLRRDGHVGPVTVSRVEHELGVEAAASHYSLEISKKGIDELVKFEVASEAYYTKRLQAPTWPGGHSGVTIGIGYDLGTQSKQQIAKDWAMHVSQEHLELLKSASGKLGTGAKPLAARLKSKGIKIPLATAKRVFLEASLPAYAKRTRKAYPGVQNLPADAQAMMLSLVYNRGTAKSGSTRREMKELGPLVKKGDLKGMAAKFREMKRLWEGKGLPGLLKRRDREALLIEKAKRNYDPTELVRV